MTGYQRISRERSTAAFGFVDSEQLNRQMHSDLASSLEGQVAGLRMNINSNTGDMSPILRGVGTFSHDVGTEPLIVVDDMPTNLRLSEINPYNVEKYHCTERCCRCQYLWCFGSQWRYCGSHDAG